jgi:hypothetical protein
MRKSLLLALFTVSLVCSLHATPAQAQRVFVGAAGSDSNPCTFASPCRSFQHAHDVTSANGEIDVLDPAGYGPITITKGISIQGHGFSGVSVPDSSIGITITASSADAVHLNGLLIEGSLIGLDGIVFNSGASLTIENCIVRDMKGNGLVFLSTATTAQSLAVSNSYFNDNARIGFDIQLNSSGGITAAIDRTNFSGNGTGLFVLGAVGTGALTVSVTDSVAANNSSAGFMVQSATSHSVSNLSLTHSLAEGDSTGVEASGANATLWLAQSTVTGNSAHGFVATSSGIINSFGDNYFAANGATTGSLTNVVKQ